MNTIGIDLGGTKVAIALVNDRKKILWRKAEPSALGDGWPGLKSQLFSLLRDARRQDKMARAIGIASAGPLHGPKGLLLDPTNFGWKKKMAVPIAEAIKKEFKIPVVLENDAAAAAIGEFWAAGASNQLVSITLGTGLGVGTLIDGQLHRGNTGLHPEAGHITLKANDSKAKCGCGNYGCAEAYLSASSFFRRLRDSCENTFIEPQNLASLAKSDPLVRSALSEYSCLFAAFLHCIVVLYYPKEIRIAGSFSKQAKLFLPETRKNLKELLRRRARTIDLMPDLQVSPLGDDAGILGAAFLAQQTMKQ